MNEVHYIDPIPTGIECILVGDIGGTNSNFGFFTLSGGPVIFEATLLFSLHIKSNTITDFPATVADILSYVAKTYNITVKRSCFAAAGIASQTRDYCKPTHLTIELKSKDIMQATGLRCAVIVNDFEVIGHGLNKIAPKDLVTINKGIARKHANKAIIGAGTGLGKCILSWNGDHTRYMPHPSEGGHADFAVHRQIEFDLISFMHNVEHIVGAVSWEDVLSGNGIKTIYSFFRNKNNTVQADKELAHNGLQPDMIFNSRNLDEHSKNSFELYTLIYARCAKNFVLDSLALGGIYIAGGIAAKNCALFQQPSFLQEFINCSKQQKLLERVPIYVITDYNISLYGAAEYMLMEGLCV